MAWRHFNFLTLEWPIRSCRRPATTLLRSRQLMGLGSRPAARAVRPMLSLQEEFAIYDSRSTQECCYGTASVQCDRLANSTPQRPQELSGLWINVARSAVPVPFPLFHWHAKTLMCGGP